MSSEFASADLTAGQLNALVKKLGGHESVLAFLRGELMVSKLIRWQERGIIICPPVISDGTNGPEWVSRLERGGFHLGGEVKGLLRSDGLHPTRGVTTKMAIIRGMLFKEENRILNDICLWADKYNLEKTDIEAACLFREMFTDEEIKAMGLSCIIFVHEPFISYGRPSLLNTSKECRLNGAYCDDVYSCDCGFAFKIPNSYFDILAN